MAHFARIDDNGTVIDKHVVVNAELLDANGVEQEALGQAFLADLWGGAPTDYVQASYNNPDYRGGYPDLGWKWDGKTFAPPAAEPEPDPDEVAD